jgi:TonB family protein
MKLNATSVSGSLPGSISRCLLDSDPTESRGARNVRRRAIVLSILLQSIAVAALIILPLLGKGERIPVRIFTERPPYRHGTDHPDRRGTVARTSGSVLPCLFCKTPFSSGKAVVQNSSGTGSTEDEPPGIGNDPDGIPEGVPNSIELPQHGPRKPSGLEATETRRLQMAHIDPSRLIRRVEPIYPSLGVQLHRETRVELHAIISADGSIQSLQVLSGDPLFYQSAVEAVSRWQYTPTILNGQAVEIDTHITVIYTLSR